MLIRLSSFFTEFNSNFIVSIKLILSFQYLNSLMKYSFILINFIFYFKNIIMIVGINLIVFSYLINHNIMLCFIKFKL
jgi:hypothetical protein